MKLGANDLAWQEDRLSVVPFEWRERLRKLHFKKLQLVDSIEWSIEQENQFRESNLWLLKTTDRIKKLKVPINLSDFELCDLAEKLAKKCFDMTEIVTGIFFRKPKDLRNRLNKYVESYSIDPPHDEIEDTAAIARMTDHLWWRRQLRKYQARTLEGEAINLGYVHKRDQIYASDITVKRREQQKRRNAKTLEMTEATNLETGEIYNLTQLAEKSVSNPKIRRGELMTRIAGFENIAKGLDHAAEFVTITAPSKYHPKRIMENGFVDDNPKYLGATPRDTQQMFCKMWAAIRAKLHRNNIRVYGFRVTESHHDGCPHWHLLLFLPQEQIQKMRDIVFDYALREDTTERGAKKNRVNFKSIDPALGTAAGYIAKYVAKNIDGGGYVVQGDIEGDDLSEITPSHRIEAWASTWGIRQFQQIGGAPVGVWRELRRMKHDERMSEKTSLALSAADAGNWRSYIEAMGGAFVERKNLTLKIAYSRAGEKWDYFKDQPYPANPTRYNEIAPPSVCGIIERKKERVFFSCRYRWKIKSKKSDMVNACGVHPWTRVNNCTDVSGDDKTSLLVKIENDQMTFMNFSNKDRENNIDHNWRHYGY